MSKFSEILKTLRLKTGYNQIQLAELLNCNRQKIADMERGKTSPTADTLVKLADLFGVSVDYLLGRTDVKTADTTIQAISEYTGLTEENVILLMELLSKSTGQDLNYYHLDFVNYCFENKEFWDAVFEVTKAKRDLKPTLQDMQTYIEPKKEITLHLIENKKNGYLMDHNIFRIHMFDALTKIKLLLERYVSEESDEFDQAIKKIHTLILQMKQIEAENCKKGG